MRATPTIRVGGLGVPRLIGDDDQHIPTFSMLGYHPGAGARCPKDAAATGGHRDPLAPPVPENPPR